MAQPGVYAVTNQKGGVGKTAVTLGLAAAESRHSGKKALIIDLDPQANATSAVGVDLNDESFTISDVLAETRPGGLADGIYASGWEGVDIVPSELDLAKTEADSALEGPYRLREAMSGLDDALGEYGSVWIDCPPALGRLLTAGLTAADAALLVTDASADGLRGVQNVLETIQQVKKYLNHDLAVAGILINRYRQSGEQEFREKEVRSAYGELVLPGHLPERTALASAHGDGRSIYSDRTDGGRALAAAFDDLWHDLGKRRAGAAA